MTRTGPRRIPHCVASESQRKKCVHVVNGVHHTKPCIQSCWRVRTTKPWMGSSTSARCAMYSRLSFCCALLLLSALSSRPAPLPHACAAATSHAPQIPVCVDGWGCAGACGVGDGGRSLSHSPPLAFSLLYGGSAPTPIRTADAKLIE